MPYLSIETNLPLSRKAERTILRTASALVAQELRKPEAFVMIAVRANQPMLFAGTDDPVAFLELKAIALPVKKVKSLSESLASLVEEHLGIPPSRVYVKFIDVRRGMWAWKGDTF